MANIPYQVYNYSKMGTFLSTIQSSQLIGFSSKRIYRHYNFLDIAFVPLSFYKHPDLVIETHLVTLKGIAPDSTAQHYLHYELQRDRSSNENLLYFWSEHPNA